MIKKTRININKLMKYTFLLFWLILAGAYFSKQNNVQPVALGSVFDGQVSGTEFAELNTFIEGYGKYGVCYLTDIEKEKLLGNIAGAIGVSKPYSLSNERKDGVNTMALNKDSVNGSVNIKMITTEERLSDKSIKSTQHVYIKLNLYDNVECACDYKELITGLFDAMGITGNVNVNLIGTVSGMLNRDEKNRVADNLLESLEAKVVAECRDNDFFTIYAYSKGIEDYITIGGSKINVNIAMNYDENKNMTNIYVSSPVNSLDY